MDATTKERMMHAAEVLTWFADEKEMQWSSEPDKSDSWKNSNASAHGVTANILLHGWKYRPKPAKTRRPFTGQEARRLVGCVLVSPSGMRSSCFVVIDGKAFRSSHKAADFCQMAEDQWHYHIPGDPDNLKPCWVEE